MVNTLLKLRSILLIAALFVVTNSQAEEVSYSGLRFEIESAEALSETEYQLLIAGQDFVVPADNWQEEAFLYCLRKNCAQFSLIEFLSFVGKEKKISPRLRQSLQAYAQKNYSEEELYSYWQQDLLARLQSKQPQSANKKLCPALFANFSACKKIEIFNARIVEARELIKSEPEKGFLLLLASFENSNELSKASPLVLSIFDEFLGSAKGEQVLRVLTILPKEFFTQSVLAALQNTLSEPELQDVSKDLQSILTKHLNLFQQNEELAKVFNDFLARQVLRHQQKGNLQIEARYAELWHQFYQALPTLSKSSKLQLYNSLIKFQKIQQAAEVRQGLEGELSWSDKWQLNIQNNFKQLNYFLIVALAVLIVSMLLWVGILFIKKNYFSKAKKRVVEEEPEVQPQQVFSVGALAQSPLMIRYKECLKKIGIETPVTVKEIKSAYRQAVKAAHPDLNNKATNHLSSDSFIELTQAYDEALALHRELGAENDKI